MTDNRRSIQFLAAAVATIALLYGSTRLAHGRYVSGTFFSILSVLLVLRTFVFPQTGIHEMLRLPRVSPVVSIVIGAAASSILSTILGFIILTTCLGDLRGAWSILPFTLALLSIYLGIVLFRALK